MTTIFAIHVFCERRRHYDKDWLRIKVRAGEGGYGRGKFTPSFKTLESDLNYLVILACIRMRGAVILTTVLRGVAPS